MIIKTLYKTIIKSDEFIKVNENLKIIISLKDFNGEYVVTSSSLPVTIILPDNTVATLGDGVGTEPKDYIFTYIPTIQGLYTIICNHTKKQFFVDGVISDDSQYVSNNLIFFYTEKTVTMLLFGSIPTIKGGWKEIGTIPQYLRPKHGFFVSGNGHYGANPISIPIKEGVPVKCDVQISDDGKGLVWYRNWDNNYTVEEDLMISWSRER